MDAATRSIAYLTEPKMTITTVMCMAVGTGFLIEMMKRRLIHWVNCQPWKSRMLPLQRKLMQNFGYSEAASKEDAMMVDAYCFAVAICSHHVVVSILLLPVILQGWEASGPIGQLMFYVGALGDLAYSIYDSLQISLRTFFPENFKFLGVQTPLKFFIIMVCMHHSLSITLTLPMILCYPSMRALHIIMYSLLLAGGSCYLLGCYKFTLDTKTKADFRRYQVVAFLQLVIIGITRIFVWIHEATNVLSFFYTEGNLLFFGGAAAGGLLMSFFNLLMFLDALQAAAKWLPKRWDPEVTQEVAVLEARPTLLKKPKSDELLFQRRKVAAAGAEVALMAN